MDTLEQMQYIRSIYLSVMDKLCKKQFLFQIATVQDKDTWWYKKRLEMLSLLSAQAEAGLMEANPRRALRYTCALYKYINDLEEKVGTDFKHIENRLVQK